MMRKYLSWLLVIFVSLQTHGVNAFTENQWREFMNGQMDVILATQMTLLSKDHSDLQALIALKLRQRLSTVASLFEALSKKKREIADAGGGSDKSLREFVLLEKEIGLLVDQSVQDASVYSREMEMWDSACSPETLRRYESSFDAGNLVPVRQILLGLNKTIDETVEDNTKGGSIYISVGTSGTGTGMQSSYVSTGPMGAPSNDWKAAVIGVFMAGGAYLAGPAAPAGAFLGSLMGTVIVGVLDGLFTGGETAADNFIDTVREEVTTVIRVMDSLRGDFSKRKVAEHCGLAFSDNAKSFAATTKETVLADLGLLRSLGSQAQALATEVEKQHQQRLLRLVEEDLPAFQERFENQLNAYFKDRQRRSLDSKAYFAKAISPVYGQLSTALSLTERARTSQSLWSTLIDGDVQFSKGNSFSFGSNDDREALIYWTPATRALVQRLRGDQK